MFCFVLCGSVDTSSIIMTFLTADGWGFLKPFSFPAVSNNYLEMCENDGVGRLTRGSIRETSFAFLILFFVNTLVQNGMVKFYLFRNLWSLRMIQFHRCFQVSFWDFLSWIDLSPGRLHISILHVSLPYWVLQPKHHGKGHCGPLQREWTVTKLCFMSGHAS